MTKLRCLENRTRVCPVREPGLLAERMDDAWGNRKAFNFNASVLQAASFRGNLSAQDARAPCSSLRQTPGLRLAQ